MPKKPLKKLWRVATKHPHLVTQKLLETQWQLAKSQPMFTVCWPLTVVCRLAGALPGCRAIHHPLHLPMQNQFEHYVTLYTDMIRINYTNVTYLLFAEMYRANILATWLIISTVSFHGLFMKRHIDNLLASKLSYLQSSGSYCKQMLPSLLDCLSALLHPC